MKIVSQEIMNRTVADGEVYSFTVPIEAVYIISVTARARNWAQNIKRLFNDDDLAIQIDGVPFYEFGGKVKEFSSAGAWSGNQLKNVHKTNWYILPLASGSHTITFVADGEPFVENIFVSNLGDMKSGIKFDEKTLPEPERNKLFFDIIIKNVNTQTVTVSALALGSDMQCYIDGVAEENVASKRYQKFFWRNNEKVLTKKFSVGSRTRTISFLGRGNPKFNKINLDTEGYRLVQHGRIAMYKDIEPYPRAKLRREPTSDSEDLGELKDGENIEITETRVEGEMQLYKSNIWHKVKTQKGEGFVLSSYIEIEGQERGIVVQKIQKKAEEIGVDAELVLLLAGVESRYKPFATSSVAKGIFQLTPDAITQIKVSEDFEVTDPYDVDQSINGGIRYAHWLQRKWYHPPVKDWRMKLFLAYNQGHTVVPPDKNIDLSRIKKPLRRKEAGDHLNHYKNNIKSFNWRNVLMSLLLMLSIGSFGLSQKQPVLNIEYATQTANVAAYHEPEISKYYPRAEVKKMDSMIVVNIYDENGRIAALIPESAILLKGALPVDPADKEWDRLTVDERVDEYPANTFYFFAANSGSCGSAGCAGGLYRIGREEIKPRLVAETSEIKNFVPSPDGFHVAVVSQGRVEEELLLIDSQNLSVQEIKFNVGNSRCAYIGLLSWSDVYTLEIESYESNCDDGPGLDKTLRHNIDTGTIRTIDERRHIN